MLDVAVLKDGLGWLAGDGKEETIRLEAAFGMKGLRHILETNQSCLRLIAFPFFLLILKWIADVQCAEL